ncbi:MAG: response regulator [Methylotetracoccus sp.]
MPQPISPTIYVVDDDDTVRSNLAALLSIAGYRVESFSNGRDFLAALDPQRPGCLLLDLRMDELDGLSVQREIIARDSRVPVIFMTAAGTIKDSVEAMRCGAFDFLEKPFSGPAMLERVKAALDRDTETRQAQSQLDEAKHGYERLSPREREIIELIINGETSKTIAKKLGISPRTVDHHRRRILEKLGKDSVAEAAYVLALAHPIPPKT